MPQDLTVRVGIHVGTITFGGTPAQVADVLERFALRVGIPIVGTATENLVAILEYFRDEVKGKSKEEHRAQLNAANSAAIEATIEVDDVL